MLEPEDKIVDSSGDTVASAGTAIAGQQIKSY